MKRRAWVLVTAVGMVLFSSVVDFGGPSPIYSETIENFVCNDVTKLADGAYLLAGGVQVGSQSWQVEPVIHIRGTGPGEHDYLIDGVDASGVSQGTVTSLAFDAIDETQIKTSGFVADYGSGGGAVVNMVTKAGTNRLAGTYFTRTDASLNDLEYAEDGTLWGAGTTFDPDPIPVLGYFDDTGRFISVDHPVEARGGFFNGVDFTGHGVAYGNTTPGDSPVEPPLSISIDGMTWTVPPLLPWRIGAINAARFLDASTGWVAGETPDGAAFAATYDAGRTWLRQTMLDATYIWDMDIALIPVDPQACPTGSNRILGAALGTYYLDDGSKESIVYRYDGSMWEELWRVPGFGGALHFDTTGDGEIGIVQNHQDGTATFTRYSAHDFFGVDSLDCNE